MRPLTRPGPNQYLVLLILRTNPNCTAADLDYHHPALTEESARAAIHSLGRRGYVDVAGFEDMTGGRTRRTFNLTAKGEAYVDALLADEDADDALERVE